MAQALAGWLGQAGHRVAAFERYEEIYRLPRAVHLDGEVMRLLQSLGVVDELIGDMLPFRDYHWFGADGEPLMTLEATTPSRSGWEPDYLFFQPSLEQALDAHARSLPGVTVERGWVADGIEPDDDGVALSLRPFPGGAGEGSRTVRAHWVVGADGANSFVRGAVGIGQRDLGFEERWLVVDVQPDDPEALDLPRACQWCDPRRPVTHVQSGRGHRRWEFMLLPDETEADFADEARVWELLAPWFTPADGRLTRHAVYEFRSILAERMREDRVLLAGDAAHLTPPFLGQGLCSGLRDAANIAWKLDLVLRDAAPESLLDSIGPERQAQNEWVINFAVELGRVLCELDPEKAAERDATLRAVPPPPEVELARLGDSSARRAHESDPLAGGLSTQARVARGADEGLLDELTGGGFTLIARDGDPFDGLGPERVDALERLCVSPVGFEPDQPGAFRDLEGRIRGWLEDAGVHAVLVRPDFYVFGSATTPADLPALADDFLDALAPQPSQA